MKFKSYISLALATVVAGTAIGAYAASGAISTGEVEDNLKPMLFSAAYEGYLPKDWYKAEKLQASMTRKDAAYLAVYTLSKASGTATDWIDYKTDLTDSNDPILSRAVDLGLMSADQSLKFNGTKYVTQQEMAVMMTKIAMKLGVYQKPTATLTYKDQKSIATWAKESVQYISQQKWDVWVKDGKFEPTKAITTGRAIALSDQLLASFGVYPAGLAVDSGKTFDVEGFKVPLPTATALEISVTPEKHVKLYFSGTIKNRSVYTYKNVEQQLIDVLDSNPKVSFTARAALISTIASSWDATTQTYNFSKDQYIRLDNGQLSTAKPDANAMLVKAGNALNIEIIQ